MIKQILVVDDDAHIREVIRFALENAGFQVLEADNGETALSVFAAKSPDLLVLDIMMPELDGTEVCRRIRAGSDVPIIFVTSKDEEIDRILGLELGGDDYVTKPFSPRELVARVKAIARRLDKSQTRPDAGRMRHGKLELDPQSYKVYWDGTELVFTVTEFNILKTLLRHPQKVFSRDELMDGAYDLNRLVSDRTIDSHVRRVRSKLAKVDADPIETVHGVGYTLKKA